MRFRRTLLGPPAPKFFRTSRSLKRHYYGGLVTRTIRLYANFERFGLSIIVGMVETYWCSCSQAIFLFQHLSQIEDVMFYSQQDT